MGYSVGYRRKGNSYWQYRVRVVMPHDHHHVLATYQKAGEKEVQMAIDAAMKAHKTGQIFLGRTRIFDAPRCRTHFYEISLP